MWTFIPRLPTQLAWSQKLFSEKFSSLDSMIDAIKFKHIKVRGQLLFNKIGEQAAINIPVDKYYMDDTLLLMFNTYQELETILNKVTQNSQLDTKLCKVYLYDYGYFMT